MDVDDAWPLVSNGCLDRAREIFAACDGDTIGVASARPSGEIGIVTFAAGTLVALIEGGPEFASLEETVLDVADCSPCEVVPHDPDARQIIFHGGCDNVRRHHEA